MGAWGHLAFDNDAAGDWADNLVRTTDLLAVVEALINAEKAEEYLDATTAGVKAEWQRNGAIPLRTSEVE